jgi:putative peptidoglycan lipid II flippase
MVRFRRPRLDESMRRFFRALGPATVGSAGLQLALFADTIIASFLSVGAVSALYYADRLNQLPIGVIGIAAGTVLLPEMARRIASGDEAGARRAQNRALEITLLLAAPCVAVFVVAPELIMRALFVRGAFTAADAAAGATLRAYALGLAPFVLIRVLVATFFARGDTATPVKASLTAGAINIGFKFLLVGPLAQVGLALATAIGAWVNVGLVIWLALRAKLLAFDARLARAVAKIAIAAAALAIVLWLGATPLERVFAGSRFGDQMTLVALLGVGGAAYVAALLALYKGNWRAVLGDSGFT